MNTNLLLAFEDVDITKELPTFLDKLTYGGMMLLIGILTVFSVLMIILLVLLAFKGVFGKVSKTKVSQQKTERSEPVPAVVAAPTQDEEIVAAISAAIAMAESESDGIKFRVVSFKKR